MGNAFGGWISPSQVKKEGTTLVELSIKHIQDAHDIVGERPDNAFTPLSLSPLTSTTSCCCCIPACWVSIPEGFTAIVSSFGAEVQGDMPDGTWSPGCHCFKPTYAVDKLVSKQLVVFDTPVKDCRTKDAINVNIDVLLVFEITNAKDFVYNLGPSKLDDSLRARQDEALRQMAFETNVDEIYDLNGEKTAHVAEGMNQFFAKDGVTIHHFTIKGVRIPEEMAKEFEEKTLLESRTTMKHMEQAYERLRLNNAEGKQKYREECDNVRMAAESEATVIQDTAIKETSAVIAQTARDIAELEATRDVEKNKVLSQSDLDISKMKSAILAMEREVNSKTQADVGRIASEAEAVAKKKETEAKIEVASKLANGKAALGEAEGVASAAFAARRAHEAEMKRLDILEKVALKDNIKIATSQENTVGMSQENSVVTQVTQQGLEALRAKLAEITATSLTKLEQTGKRPTQQHMA